MVRQSRGRRNKKLSVFEEEALPHMDTLYHYARHLTRHDRDAEDLVQDTYVKAYRFFDSYQPGTNCKAWLFRIMTNAFLKKNRRNVREFSFIENVDVDDGGHGPSIEERSSFYRDPEREVLSHMVHEEVRQALDALPPHFRTVVLLADLQDFTYKEIAEVMDCPVGTVMSRLFRARKALQSVLLKYATEQGYVQGTPTSRRRGRRPRTQAPGDAPESDAKPDEKSTETPPSLAEYRQRRCNGDGATD